MIRRVAWGAGKLVQGATYLGGRPRLWGWVVLPMLLALALIWASWMISWSWSPWLLHWLLPRPETPGFAQNLWSGLALVVVLWGFITAVLLLYSVFGALAAPFYDRLSAAVEEERRTLPEGFDWRDELRAVGRSIGHSLIAAALWIAVLAVVALLNLLPGGGTVLAGLISWVATALFFAREMMDGPTSRRGWSFGEKVALVRREPAACLGFGLVASALLVVPLVNVVLLPVGVVGGTLLFLELEAPVGPQDLGPS